MDKDNVLKDLKEKLSKQKDCPTKTRILKSVEVKEKSIENNETVKK